MEKLFIPMMKGNGKVNKELEGVGAMNTSPSLWMTLLMSIVLLALCIFGIFNPYNQGKNKEVIQALYVIASISALLPIAVLVFIIVTTKN